MQKFSFPRRGSLMKFMDRKLAGSHVGRSTAAVRPNPN
jgi:hypothetical protein